MDGDYMESLIFNDPNFNEETLRIINLYPPLAKWFKKNQFMLSYYECTKPKFDFTGEFAKIYHSDIVIFRKMTNFSLTWINTKYEYTDMEKALKAAAAIFRIYAESASSLQNKDLISNFAIDINTSNDESPDMFYGEFMQDVLNPPDLKDMELDYLEQKRAELMQQVSQAEEQMLQIETRINVLKGDTPSNTPKK